MRSLKLSSYEYPGAALFVSIWLTCTVLWQVKAKHLRTGLASVHVMLVGSASWLPEAHLIRRVQYLGLIWAGDLNNIFATPSASRLCCQAFFVSEGWVGVVKRRVIGVTSDQRAWSDWAKLGKQAIQHQTEKYDQKYNEWSVVIPLVFDAYHCSGFGGLFI